MGSVCTVDPDEPVIKTRIKKPLSVQENTYIEFIKSKGDIQSPPSQANTTAETETGKSSGCSLKSASKVSNSFSDVERSYFEFKPDMQISSATYSAAITNLD